MKKFRATVLNQTGVVHILLLIVLLAGIVGGVYLVNNSTLIFKPKASSNPIINALEMKDSSGKSITCDSSTNPPNCETETQDITIKIKDLDALIPK